MPAQTKRQSEVLDIITRHLDANGYRPSYQAIAKSLRLRSRSGIARIVKDLESQGLLERQRENGHFSIKVQDANSMTSVAWLDLDGRRNLGPMVLPIFVLGPYHPDSVRIVRVTDSSMGPEIEVDDIILVELRDFCRNGQRVVARLGGGAMILRKYFRTGSDIEFRSPDPAVPPISVPANEVTIIGVYRGLIRPAV